MTTSQTEQGTSHTGTAPMDAERFQAGMTFAKYLDAEQEYADLWRGVYDRVRLPHDLVEEARALGGAWKLAVLSEDWCGDAVNTVPVVARLAEEVGWELRVFPRDDNLDLMDAHLTDGRSRSIPVVIVYDQDFREVGWWGPRPRELQEWVLGEGQELPPDERYKVTRGWYARDRGRTTLEELLALFPRRRPEG